MKSDSYFQFPLCLLAYGAGERERLQAIIDYCTVRTGSELDGKLTTAQRDEIFKGFAADRLPAGFRKNAWEHQQIVLGMHLLHIRGGAVESILQNHSLATEFIADWTGRYGPQPQVRIKAEYVWEVRDNQGMSYREFAVLCAVYCIIGAKQCPVWITRQRIKAAALGYKSVGLLEEQPERKDNAFPLTEDQLRYTLDTLEAQGHFARCQGSKRRTYFSHRMKREHMREQLLLWKTQRGFVLKSQRDADRALQAKIKATNEANGVHNTPRSPHYNSGSDTHTAGEKQPPSSPHIVPIPSPLNPHSVPTIIETSFIETPLIETSLIETQRRAQCESAVDATMEEVSQFATQCIKGSVDFVGEFMDAVAQGKVNGDWKRAFIKLVTGRMASKRRQEQTKALYG